MTTQDLQSEYDRKMRTLQEALDEGIIDYDAHVALMERVRCETYFAMDVLCDIESLPVCDERGLL